MNHWINAANVKKTLIALGVIAAFSFFLLDPVLRWSLARAGQAAAGAKVDVGSVRTRLLSGRLTVRRLAVADKHEPMKNLLEFEEAAFQFSPGQALRGKCVINEAELLGLQFGTARQKSGALRRSPPGALERMVDAQLAPVQQNFNMDASKVKAAAALVDPAKLQSLKSLASIQGQLAGVGGGLKDKLGVGTIDAQIKEIDGLIKQTQGGGGAASKAQLALDVQKKVKALLTQVDQSRALVKTQFDDVQAQLKKAKELKDKDANGLLQAAGLPAMDPESLTRHFLGPATSKKLETALYWIAWARKRAASSDDQAAQPPPRRRKGVDFEFPRPGEFPRFLLEKAELTGKVASALEGRDMELSGLLAGITSNPRLYGKPARLRLKGVTGQGGPKMSLEASVDQKRGDTEVNLNYAGIPLAGTALGDSQLGAELKSGTGRVEGSLKISGDQWRGSARLEVDGASISPTVKIAGPAAPFAAAALSGIKRFGVNIAISGREGDLHFNISSDLGQALAEGMKKGFSGELARQRKLLEDKIDALYAGRAKDLQGQIDGLQKQLLAPLDRQQGLLNEQLKRAVPKGFWKSIPGLEKLFR